MFLVAAQSERGVARNLHPTSALAQCANRAVPLAPDIWKLASEARLYGL